MENNEGKTKPVLIKEFYGEGMTAKEFMEEYRKLTPEDRTELAEEIAKKQGVKVKHI